MRQLIKPWRRSLGPGYRKEDKKNRKHFKKLEIANAGIKILRNIPIHVTEAKQ